MLKSPEMAPASAITFSYAVLGVEKITNRRESDGTTDHLENVMNLM